MKERPILFSAPMVRAILDGTKTQTRRVVKLCDSGRIKKVGSFLNWHPEDPNCVQACPYGQPGDRLWVKETWRTQYADESNKPSQLTEGYALRYEADGHETAAPLYGWGRIRQSIFMRRWMSRITLEITGIRVERLQDISEEDAIAEGVTIQDDARLAAIIAKDTPARMEYRALWSSINGPDSWNTNPYVWIVEFKRISNHTNQ